MDTELELHLIEHCEIMCIIWFQFKDMNITRLGSQTMIESIAMVVTRSWCMYPVNSAKLRRQIMAFEVIVLQWVWEERNRVVHDGHVVDLDSLFIEIDRDIREEEERVKYK